MLNELREGLDGRADNFLGETVAEAWMTVHERAIEQDEDDDAEVGNPCFDSFDDSFADRQRFITQGREQRDGTHRFEQEEVLEHQQMKRGKDQRRDGLAAQHQVEGDQQEEQDDEEVRVDVTHPLLVEAWVQQNEQREEEGGLFAIREQSRHHGIERGDSRPAPEHGEQLPDGGVRGQDEPRQLIEPRPDGTRIGEVFRGRRRSQLVANPRDGLVVPVKAQTPEG